MKYSLRAVKGAQLARIHFDADNDREARGMCREVYDDFAPHTELWLEGRVVAVGEDGTIIHTFAVCDSCDRIRCSEDCGNYEI
jgi:hypothetical protein